MDMSKFSNLSKAIVESISNNMTSDINKELNIILEGLSNLDFSQPNLTVQNVMSRERQEKKKHLNNFLFQASKNLIDSFPLISPTDEVVFQKCLKICFRLLSKQKVLLPNINFEKLTDWLIKGLNFENNDCCEVLHALHILLKYRNNVCSWNVLLTNGSKLLIYLQDVKTQNLKRRCNKSPEEITTNIVCCLDALVLIPDNFVPNPNLILLGNVLIELLLSNEIQFEESVQHLNFLIATLSLLNKAVRHSCDWQDKVIGSLLGICRAYMMTGIEGIPQLIPQKISVSQQSLIDTAELNIENKGGKVTKARKLRTLVKNKRPDSFSKIGVTNIDIEIECKYI